METTMDKALKSQKQAAEEALEANQKAFELENAERALKRIDAVSDRLKKLNEEKAQLEGDFSELLGVEGTEDQLNQIQNRIREIVVETTKGTEEIVNLQSKFDISAALEARAKIEKQLEDRKKAVQLILNSELGLQEELNGLKAKELELQASIEANDENAITSAKRLRQVRKEIESVEKAINKAKEAETAASEELAEGDKKRAFDALNNQQKVNALKEQEAALLKRAQDGDLEAAKEYNKLVEQRLDIEKTMTADIAKSREEAQKEAHDKRMDQIEKEKQAEMSRIDEILEKEKGKVDRGVFSKRDQKIMRSAEFGRSYREEQKSRKALGFGRETEQEFAKRKKKELLDQQASEAKKQAEIKAKSDALAMEGKTLQTETHNQSETPIKKMQDQEKQSDESSKKQDQQGDNTQKMAEDIASIKETLSTLQTAVGSE